MRRGRLEVPRVLSQASAGRVTARAHARMISQSPLVQIRMRQCIHHGDPLVLREVRERGQRTIDTRREARLSKTIDLGRLRLFTGTVNRVNLPRGRKNPSSNTVRDENEFTATVRTDCSTEIAN